MHTFWGQGNKVPEIIVRSLSLRKGAVGLLLGRMDQIWELDRILDKKYRNVVADNVPIAFFGIELYREASHVTGEIGRSFIPGDSRESNEGRSFLSSPLEDICSCNARLRFVILEIAMRPETTSMNDTLRNAFVIKVEDLFSKMRILQQGRTASADPQRILVVGDRRPLLCRENWRITFGDLMRLPTFSPIYFLISQSRGFTPIM